MAKISNTAPVDPLASVSVAAPASVSEARADAPVQDPETAKAPPPPVEKLSGPPAPEPKSYRVLEDVPRLSIRGQVTSLKKGQILSELGYSIDALKMQGIKLELVK